MLCNYWKTNLTITNLLTPVTWMEIYIQMEHPKTSLLGTVKITSFSAGVARLKEYF